MSGDLLIPARFGPPRLADPRGREVDPRVAECLGRLGVTSVAAVDISVNYE